MSSALLWWIVLCLAEMAGIFVGLGTRRLAWARGLGLGANQVKLGRGCELGVRACKSNGVENFTEEFLR
jgi:hypothetical protein